MHGLRRLGAESLATLLVTLTVLGAATEDVVVGALAVGAVVAVVLRAGAHANPALTLAAVVARRTPATELLPTWAAQLVGALAGAALSRWLLAAPALDPLQAVGAAELLVVLVLFAFVLTFVALDAGHHDGPAPLLPDGWAAGAAGLVVVAAAAVLDPAAAAAFNPAAAFGQVVAGVTGWATIWAYVAGCPAGAAMAGLLARQPRSSSG